jgi:hypothetical protein
MRAVDRRASLTSLAGLLAGCSYYQCRDTLKADYVPEPGQARWVDASTLELDLGVALADPALVDPRRFALLRGQTDGSTGYGECYLETCYRELAEGSSIPESLSWDPESPSRLRLHFTAPIPATSCEPWSKAHSDIRGLSLVMFGESLRYDYYQYGEPPPVLLTDGSGVPLPNIGPIDALFWREDCVEINHCGFEDFCTWEGRYWDYDEFETDELWIPCP